MFLFGMLRQKIENVTSAGNGAFEGLELSTYLPHLRARPPEESAAAFTPLLTPFFLDALFTVPLIH